MATALLALGLLLLLLAGQGRALDNGVARRPPMGWMSWERFTCELDCERHPENCISERLYAETAERMVADGFRAAGYQYVSVDDCWSEPEREPESRALLADRSRFPRGIRWLAEFVGARGLQLGLYGDCGTSTCAGYPAQLNSDLDYADNNFARDAETLVGWRVGMFKLDGCFVDPRAAERVCPGFSRALAAAGGRRVLLTCEWPFYAMYAHAETNLSAAAEHCNTWRYYDDIEDSWWSVRNTIDQTVRHQATIVKFHGPGRWFDPDQLVVGNFGLSREQARAQMAIWSIWSAPLFMSTDLRALDGFSSELLRNEHLIRVNQDALGVLGLMVAQSADGQLQAFVKPVEPIRNKCPSFALVYLNRREAGNRAKVAFGLRALLAAAPIREAAKRQAELRAYGLGPAELAEDLRAPAYAAEPIEAGECLRRLLREEPELSFSAFDLIERRALGQVRVGAQLELLVPPTGVRALRLEELPAP